MRGAGNDYFGRTGEREAIDYTECASVEWSKHSDVLIATVQAVYSRKMGRVVNGRKPECFSAEDEGTVSEEQDRS